MNTFNVAKFGGTSVADFDAMNRCAEIIKHNPTTRLVVISACSGVTNILVELAQGITDATHRMSLLKKLADIHEAILTKLTSAEEAANAIYQLLDHITSLSEAASIQSTLKLTDHLVACGELMSTYLLTQVLREQGMDAVRFDVREILRTDDSYGRAEPDIAYLKAKTNEILYPLCKQHIVITQGFIGSDSESNTTTLGRGGSDYSAALLAEALRAHDLSIWTDVPGLYTTDPRLTDKARAIDEISFSEASEMANFGAKVLHPSTLLPAVRCDIPVYVGSSKDPQAGGTWIRHSVKNPPLFRAVTLRRNQTKVTLRSADMFFAYGFLADVFEILAKHKISVDLITTSEVSVSLTLDHTDATSGDIAQLPDAARDELEQLCSVEIEHDLCLIALIGNQMDTSKGYTKKVFSTLDNYNIRMVCFGASQHNLCFLVDEKDAKQAVIDLHNALFD